MKLQYFGNESLLAVGFAISKQVTEPGSFATKTGTQ
jgi:hypothetical protein